MTSLIIENDEKLFIKQFEIFTENDILIGHLTKDNAVKFADDFLNSIYVMCRFSGVDYPDCLEGLDHNMNETLVSCIHTMIDNSDTDCYG